MRNDRSAGQAMAVVSPLVLVLGGGLIGFFSTKSGEALGLVPLLGAGVLVLMPFAGTVVPAGFALCSLLLLPKSLPLLRFGSMSFAWSLGDLTVMLAFGLSFIGLTTRRRSVRPGDHRCRMDRAMIFYSLSLIPAMVVGALRCPGQAVFVVGSVVKSLEVPMLYAVARAAVRDQRSEALALGFFVAALAVTVGLSLLQQVAPDTYRQVLIVVGARGETISESLLIGLGSRLAGPFLNANSLGRFLVLAIPLLIAQHGFSVQTRARSILDYLLLSTSLVVLVLTLSREAYLGFLVAGSYLVIAGARARGAGRFTTVMVLATVALGAYYWPVLYRRVILYTFGTRSVSLIGLGSSPSVEARIQQWVAGIKALVPYGFVGAGLGQVGQAVGRFLPAGSPYLGGSHQTYLRAWIEGGAVGLLALLYVLWAVWVTAESLPIVYKVALRASLLGLMVTGLAADTFQAAEILVPLMYLTGSLQASNSAAEPDGRQAQAGTGQPHRQKVEVREEPTPA